MNTIQYLENEGWIESCNRFKPTSRCFYKRFDTPTRCNLNDDKAGIQVAINVSQWEGRESFEIEICGEAKDESWIQMLNYGYIVSIEEGLKTISRLIAMWEVFTNYKPNEQ
jgi:hypothetical protein